MAFSIKVGCIWVQQIHTITCIALGYAIEDERTDEFLHRSYANIINSFSSDTDHFSINKIDFLYLLTVEVGWLPILSFLGGTHRSFYSLDIW